jgi:hypothetical protein
MARPTEIPAFVCSHVYDAAKPILLVSREDGDWQFLCGEPHDAQVLPRVVGLNHLIERDPSLKEIVDLAIGHDAEREFVGAPWVRTGPANEPK